MPRLLKIDELKVVHERRIIRNPTMVRNSGMEKLGRSLERRGEERRGEEKRGEEGERRCTH